MSNCIQGNAAMGTKSTAFVTHQIYEPYRATRLWNEVVRAFRADLPRGCHRKRMKNYEDCFVASDAVDWLLSYLQKSPHFGPDVCRQQAIQLLQKFLQCNLMEELGSRKNENEPKFEDNKQLYRVKRATPLKSPAPKCLKRMMRTPAAHLPSQDDDSLALENRNVRAQQTPDIFRKTPRKTLALRNPNAQDSDLDSCSEVLNDGTATKTGLIPCQNEKEVTKGFQMSSTLSPREVANIWKSVLWNKLLVTVALPNLEAILNPSLVLGQTIIHNETRVQRNGIVTSLDKSDDIPNWIMCAMKCLAKWPNASGSSSCLPNYPGFEKDVFKVVQDHFLSLDEPLIPLPFYSIIATLYNFATKKINGFETSIQNTKVGLTNTPNHSMGSNAVAPNHPLKTLEKNDLVCSGTQIYKTPSPEHTNAVSSCSSDAVLELCRDRASYCFETVFSEENPLTRIIRKPAQLQSNTNIGVYKKCQSTEDITKPNLMPTKNGKESGDVKRQGLATQRYSSLKWLSLDHLAGRNSRFQFEKRDKTRTGLKQVYYGKSFDNPSKEVLKSAQCGSLDCISIGSSVISASSSMKQNMVIRNPYVNPTRPDPKGVAKVTRAHSTAGSTRPRSSIGAPMGRKPARCLSALDKPAEPQSGSVRTLSLPGSHRLVKSFQLVLLLIPASNRRKLHLLLRFLNKIKMNRTLQLFPAEFAQILIVRMFWCSILRAPSDRPIIDGEETTLGCQVVEFLLDHCEAVLAPLPELKDEVENVITLLCQSRMRHLGKDCGPQVSYPVTFCEQVTNQMYEDQKPKILHSSLLELLEEIVRNPALTKKERLKKLQKFHKQYPSVYEERFQTDKPPQGTKRKSTLLNMLRSLRF